MKVGELSEKEVAEIMKGFRTFDPKNTGYIEGRQLGNALRWLKLIPSEAQIQSFLEILDPKKSGWISMELFLVAAAELWYGDSQHLERQLWDAFSLFDPLLCGTVHREVMWDILTKRGLEPIPVKEAEKLIRKYEDAHNRVEYSYLIHELMK
ncbi:Calmodulin [Paragonimus kellicotti]|nr:Calmodulin [Paragonimus kellicotti]